MSEHPPELADFISRHGLVENAARWSAEPLKGGVSSDIWKITSGQNSFCVKSALAQLRTKEKWTAPVSRNANEVAWLNYVGEVFPENVPSVLAHDAKAGLFAMDFLPSDTHALWKAQLLQAKVDVPFAFNVGHILGGIHAKSAHDLEVSRKFDNFSEFTSLRIAPYLLHLKNTHSDMTSEIDEQAESLKLNRKVLIHGDVSPKNILIGPNGAVFLDSETACFGDPAFDVAFCLNHLLLKMVKVRSAIGPLRESFERLLDGYFAHVDWEGRETLEARVSKLLPMLTLARVDGKSPAEYITDKSDKDRIRKFTRAVISAKETTSLLGIANDWTKEFS